MHIVAAVEQRAEGAHVGSVGPLGHVGTTHMVDHQRDRDRIEEGAQLGEDIRLEIDHDMPAGG